MATVNVPVLWDSNDSFMNSGLVQANVLSVVVGEVLKPNRVYPPSAIPTTQTTLRIMETSRGELFLNMTLAAYQTLLRASASGSGVTPVLAIYNITETTSTITDPALEGATILSLWKNGANMDPTGLLVGDTITFSSELADGDTVGIVYYID